jgi:2-polyprenyl-3-methyl-5-hydroxy-6-metoxy-1,4-benzoquinol methylase
MKIRRKLTLGTLSTLRQRPGIRRLVLQFFVWLHNASYHMIAFFASHTGRHPKHDILRYHEFFLNHLTPNQSVLDIGCGKGEVTSAVVKKAKRVVGIDISPINIATPHKFYYWRCHHLRLP